MKKTGEWENGNLSGAFEGAPTWVPGWQGTALQFDGVDDVVTFPGTSDFKIVGDLTFSLWVNPAEAQDYRRLLGKGGSGKRDFGLWIGKEGSGRLLFQTGEGPGFFDVFSQSQSTQQGLVGDRLIPSFQTWPH